MSSPISANIINKNVENITARNAIIPFSLEVQFSVILRKIGTRPIGFTRVNKVEKHKIKNSILLLKISILHFPR